MKRQLTKRDRDIIREALLCGNGGDAYFKVTGNSCTRRTAQQEACKIINSEAGIEYRKQIEADLRKKDVGDLYKLIGQLNNIRDLAIGAADYSVARACVMDEARLTGHLDTKVHHTHTMRVEEARDVVARLLPKYAHMLPASLRVIEQNDDDAGDDETDAA